MPLFPGIQRHVEVDAATVDAAVDELERRWPGVRDRLCEPGPRIRSHIHFYVDKRASDPRHAARTGVSRRRHRGDQRGLNVVAADMLPPR